MNYFLFSGQVATVFLSLSNLTVLNFQSKVSDYVGGKRGEVSIMELNKGKSLVFESKKKTSSSFVAFLKDSQFHFKLQSLEFQTAPSVKVFQAKPCQKLLLLKETSSYKLFACPKSLYVVNLLPTALKVNEFTVKESKFISKGPPLKINGELVYFGGIVEEKQEKKR